MSLPSEAQLRYLRNLKYSGVQPLSKSEASFLIDGRTKGKDSQSLEKAMLRERAKRESEWFKQRRQHVKLELQQAKQSMGAIVGFRIRVGGECSRAKKYNGAVVFLPTAKKYPELLPPYKGICHCNKCECDFEEILECDRLSPKTPLILGPARLSTIGKGKGGIGCIGWVGILLIASFIVWAILR